MKPEGKLNSFAKYAWLALGYNLVVILWGVFLRASKSGDGCGQYWLTCHGEVIPTAPQLKTVIEFSHRLTSGLAFFAVLILVIWAFRKYESGDPIRKTAVISFIFIITEALVGAGLVLTGNTAEAMTDVRPFWAIGHLLNTFILLSFLSLTAWFARGNRRLKFKPDSKTIALLALAVIGLLFVGMSGSIAALGNMLFPSESLAEGIAKDFSATSNILLRLRLSHPIISVLTSVYVIFLAGWIKAKAEDSRETVWWSNTLSILLLVQLAFGAATLLSLGPIVMQLGHLLLADTVWISFVLMCANFFSSGSTSATEMKLE